MIGRMNGRGVSAVELLQQCSDVTIITMCLCDACLTTLSTAQFVYVTEM